MQDVLFYSLYLAPFVVLALYRDRTGFHVLKVTCANTLMLFYMVNDHLGLLRLYFGQDGVKQLAIVNREIVIQLAFYSLIVLVAYLTTAKVLGSKYTSVRIPDIDVLRTEKINLLPIILITLVVLPIAITKVLHGSPLLILLSGDASGANIARVEEVTSGTLFFGIKTSYVNIPVAVLGFASLIVLVALMVKRKVQYLFLFIFITLVMTLYGFSNVAKGAIVAPLYSILFVYSLIYARGILLNKVTWWGLVYAMSVVSIFSAWVMGNEIIDIWGPFERLILGNLLPQYVVVDSFGIDNLLWGTTVPSWFSFGSHKQFLLDVFAWKELMGWTSGSLFYTAPSSFVAEAHANFHVVGVVIVSYFVFFALRTIDFLIKTIRSETVYTALMVGSSLTYSGMAIKGASTFIIDYYYWSVLLFALFFYRITFLPASGASRRIPSRVVQSGLP